MALPVTKRAKPVPIEKFSEEELVIGLECGDGKIISLIYKRNIAGIRNMVNQYSNTILDADDVIQEGLIRTIMNIRDKKFKGANSIHTYLYSICKNICLKEYQKSKIFYPAPSGIDLIDEPQQDYYDLLQTVLKIKEQLEQKCIEIIDLGEKGICEHGFVYDSNASISANAQRVQLGSSEQTGNFEAVLTDLRPHTRYYINSFLSNGSETIYGNQVSFTTTGTGTVPTVSTNSITNITETSATGGGNITVQGSSLVTACGICWSTSTNPTIASSHTTDGNGIGVFVSSITGLIPNTSYYVRAYGTNSVGTAYGNEASFTTLTTWACGSSFTINHIAGSVAPVTKTVTYGTVKNIPGESSKCWITSNLGADHQANANSDATEASAGWYCQFNRKQGFKHDGTTRTPNTTWITTIDEDIDWQAANDPCTLELGSGWRLPTYQEWFNVFTSGGWWTSWNVPWNSNLKLHAAGNLKDNDGSLVYLGSSGLYWSSTRLSAFKGWNLIFNSGGSSMNTNSKAYGFSIRCLRD